MCRCRSASSHPAVQVGQHQQNSDVVVCGVVGVLYESVGSFWTAVKSVVRCIM